MAVLFRILNLQNIVLKTNMVVIEERQNEKSSNNKKLVDFYEKEESRQLILRPVASIALLVELNWNPEGIPIAGE